MTFLNIALLDAGVNTFYVNITFAHAAFKASSALHGSVSTCTLCMTSACQTQEVQECGPPLPPFALLPFFFCFPLVPRDSSPNPSSLKDIRLVSSKKKKASLMPWGEHAGTNLESVKQGTRFLCCSPVCFCHSVEGYVKHCLWTYHFITGNPFCSALLTCQNYFSITSQVYNDLCAEGWAGILTISLTDCEYLLWSLFPEREADLFSVCLFSLPQ